MSIWNFENMAFPIVDGGIKSVGLSKRDLMATMMLQALISRGSLSMLDDIPSNQITMAVAYADALMVALSSAEITESA